MSAPQFISAEAIHAYCSLMGIEKEDDILLLIRMLTILDNFWMDDWTKKEKSRQKTSSKPTSGKRF